MPTILKRSKFKHHSSFNLTPSKAKHALVCFLTSKLLTQTYYTLHVPCGANVC